MNPYQAPTIPSESPAYDAWRHCYRARLISAAAFAMIGWLLCPRVMANPPLSWLDQAKYEFWIVLLAAACGYAVCAVLQVWGRNKSMR